MEPGRRVVARSVELEPEDYTRIAFTMPTDLLSRIDVAAKNRLGRPVRFVVTDARGGKFYWTGEEIRWAVNTDATENTKLMSSLFDIDSL